MNNLESRSWNLSIIVLLALLTAYYIWGISKVPFHPDESTFLYMSGDLEEFIKDPSTLFWKVNNQDNPKQHYRTIDAPLTRYLIEITRVTAGYPLPQEDWDWSQSWDTNSQKGALPEQDLLASARIAAVLLMPASLWLLYKIGSAIQNSATGLVAVILLGLNALFLLHNRHAMAESALTFGILLASWSFMRYKPSPWLSGIAMAVAFNAKHSALPLLPIGLLAVCWFPAEIPNRYRKILASSTQYLIAFGILTFAFNPYLWRHPLKAARATLDERQTLLTNQTNQTLELAPNQVLETPSERIIVLIANVFIISPSFSDVGNYSDQTAPSESAYIAIPGHNLLRGFALGGILFALSLTGLILALLQLRTSQRQRFKAIVLTFLSTVALVLFNIITIPIPWQRYSMSLIPFTSLWAAFAVDFFRNQFIINLGDKSSSVSPTP